MMALAHIRWCLEDRKLDVVSAKTGVHRNTLSAIRDGRNENPTLRTLEALSEYFENQWDRVVK
jgi:transcriptional regulator with XRE-family HTH domain